jgi:hypothetical protein
MKPKLGWHFTALDQHLGYDDGRLVVAGETLTVLFVWACVLIERCVS